MWKVVLFIIPFFAYAEVVTFGEPQVPQEVLGSEFQKGISQFETYKESLPFLKNSQNYPQIMVHENFTSKVIVLTHGLSDSPWYMQKLLEHFYDLGFNGFSILLPGHGRDAKDLEKVKLKDWQNTLKMAVNIASKLGKDIYLAGFSTGGALSIDYAVSNPGRIKGMFLFSPATQIADKGAKYAPLGLMFGKEWGRTGTDLPASYGSIALNAVNELLKLISLNKNKYSEIIIPSFWAVTASDATIVPTSIIKAYNEARGDKLLFYIPKSYDIPHSAVTRPDSEKGNYPYQQEAYKNMLQNLDAFLARNSHGD